MLTTEIVRTDPRLDQSQAARVVELWRAAYPAMREILDTVIAAQRRAPNPTVDLPHLEGVRRELGQMDRGTYRVCTHGDPAFSPFAAHGAVHTVLNVTSIGSPHAGGIYRLAAELADFNAADVERRRAERAPAEGNHR